MSKRRERKPENPRRLCLLLEHIRTDIFKIKSRQKMAELLGKAIRIEDGFPTCASMSAGVVQDLEKGTISIRYTHLEAYARLLNIPTGILLLISHMQFNTHKNEVKNIVSDLALVVHGGLETSATVGWKELKRLSELIGDTEFTEPPIKEETQKKLL